MADLKDVIKSLVQQCNIESISTKDLTKELTTLYGSVEQLESEIKRLKASEEVQNKDRIRAQDELAQYKRTHVEPADKLAKDRIAFEREQFKFSVEKEFLKKETDIYKELVRSLTATVMKNESWNGGNNGGYWSKGEQSDKPMLPNAGTAVNLP